MHDFSMFLSSLSNQELESIKLFNGLAVDAIDDILEHMSAYHLDTNATLFEKGEASNGFYLLMEGKLGVYHSEAKSETCLLGFIGEGETVGEIGVISKTNRTAYVFAEENCTLLKISAEDFISLKDKYPEFIFNICRILSDRVIDTSERYTLYVDNQK